ncbi:MAG: MBL fold metallo-hydrolase [Clostridia bacterium]|nr:MBL fold metallo-hydrolase [Clostridia bacterium]
MLIQCLGHSKFLVTLMSGYRIVTDPFDASTGYPVGNTKADTVLVSHHHHDHDAVETIKGYSTVIDTAGRHTLDGGILVRSLESFHDARQGELRGPNLIHCIEAEGIQLVHLGDLGHLPDRMLADRIGRPDILMIPVGGYYTIDAQAAIDICEMICPRMILPMHYRTAFNDDWPIENADRFVSLCLEHFGSVPEELDLLRVTADDLACQPHVALLRPQV